MARNTTLIKLLDMYRAECRLSFNPAHNAQDRDRQVNHIQRVQEYLWDDFDWPLLRVYRQINLQNGQRYYSPPSDMHIDRINRVECFRDEAYYELKPGIDDVHLTAYNSNRDERQWPPQRWQITEDEQIEIWPIPNGNADPSTLDGTLRLTGIRNLPPLVADSDRAILDDRLIILFCAAEFLAAKGDKSADLKFSQAKQRYAKLRGAQMPRRTFGMFNVHDQQRTVQRVPIAVYNKPST
ncbi:MAG: hypothetical protein ACOVN5_07140 [Aquidulcibacter sp.]